jgi:amidase
MQIIDLSATDLSLAIHRKQVSCKEVMQAYLARIQEMNPTYNAIVSLVDSDTLLALAEVRDDELQKGQSRGWMHGMPIAIKDIAPTAGLKTTNGSRILKDFVPSQDGLMVERIKGAGAVVIGKTNVPEFGLGSHTFNEVFGVTANAFDPTKSAGGSSGGAATALALKMLAVADGSDFMGSLRNPAAWNNIYGMRPSCGRVPLYPSTDVYLSTLSTEGPMARNVTDLAALLETQSGPDPRTPYAINESESIKNLPAQLSTAPKEIKVAWMSDLNGYLPMESGVLEICETALRRFESLNKTVRVDHVSPLFDTHNVWQAWCTWRSTIMGIRLGPYLTQAQNKGLMKPEALWEYEQSLGIEAKTLAHASIERTRFYQFMLEHFKTHDVLALPAAQVWPFDKTWRWPKNIMTPKGDVAMDTYHRWMEVVIYATFAGLPCISVPAGFNEAGLAMGIQLIGKPNADKELLQIAYAYAQTHLSSK